MSQLEIFISSLMQTLKVLAAPADEQIKYLQSIGGASVDELGLEFEEVWLMVDSVMKENGIKDYQYCAIKKLNDKLDMLSEKAWAEHELAQDAEWEVVRRLASECIKLFSDE